MDRQLTFKNNLYLVEHSSFIYHLGENTMTKASILLSPLQAANSDADEAALGSQHSVFGTTL